jgi:hemin uptake protein HemP
VRTERKPTIRPSDLPTGAPSVVPTESDMRVIPVESILAGQREAVLSHNGVRYRLRVTSNDKLILTK